MASATISEQGRILYVWTGTEWVPVGGSGAGGGGTVYFQSASPSAPPTIGDIWVDEDGSFDSTDSKPVYIWNGLDWIPVGDGGGLPLSGGVIDGNLEITGDFVLSSASPSLDIDRGSSPTVSIRWNESEEKWQFTNDGTDFKELGSSAVLYQSASPDGIALDLEIGTIWVDSDADLAEDLGTSHIHPQYLSLITASNTYLTITDASSTYLTQSSASSIYATPENITSAIENLIDAAPSSLNTLNELAAALNDDENFASTVTNEIATKLSIVSASNTYTTQEYAEANYLKPTTASNILFTGNVTITGALNVQELSEVIARRDIVSNVLTANYSDGNIFYVASSLSGNFTVNLTNAPTTDNKTFSISVIVPQGSTGYYPNAFQIDGNSQTIRWSGGSAPVPTSSSGKIDIFTFTLLRTDLTWFILGSSNLNF